MSNNGRLNKQQFVIIRINVKMFFKIIAFITITIQTSSGISPQKISPVCTDYGDVENARIQLVNHENTLRYQVLLVQCNLGYYLEGHSKVICNNGIWDPPEKPRCLSRDCDAPPTIKNGMIQVDGKVENNRYSKGTLAVYKCNNGFRMFPPESVYRVCEMGIWTGTLGECVSKERRLLGCRRPNDISNGYFVIENENLEHTFDVGQRIHYSCNPGYSVAPGESTVQQCLDNGSWSPKLQPTCLKLDEEDEHRCGPVYSGEHTTAEVVRGALVLNHGALLGTQLEVRCRRGYHDQSTNCKPQILQCVTPGIWKGQPPTCVAVSSCPTPPYVSNAIMYNYVLHNDESGSDLVLGESQENIVDENNEIDGQQTFSVQTRYPFGAQVAYKCIPGYKMRGNFLLTCYESGCWHPNGLPECEPQPIIEDRQVLTTSSTLIISMVTAAGVLCVLLAICGLLFYRHKKIWFITTEGHHHHTAAAGRPLGRSSPVSFAPVDASTAALLQDPDRLALIAYADGMQSGLPTYEEAVRERNVTSVGSIQCRPQHRIPHWSTFIATSRRIRGQVNLTAPTTNNDTNRQIPCSSHTSNLRHGSLNQNGLDPMGSTDTMSASEVSTNITLDTVSSHTCSSGSQIASCRAICGSLASFDTTSVANIEGVPLLEECEHEDITTGEYGQDQSSDNTSFKIREVVND